MARNSIIGWIVKKLKGNMALVEDSTTASQNISANKYVVFQGVLCTADAAISQGDTLATSGAGKNLTEVTGGGFNALNDNIAKIPISYSASTMHEVNETITAGNSYTVPATGWYTLAINGNGTASAAFYLRSNDTSFTSMIVGNQSTSLICLPVFLKKDTILYTRSGTNFLYKVMNYIAQ